MVDVVFADEKYSEAMWEEFWPVLLAHKDEISNFPDDTPLSPVRQAYEDIAAIGALKIFTARVSGELVGYVVLFLSPHLHYSTLNMAQQDIFFLLPEFRRGYTGRDLLRFAEENVKRLGVEYIRQNVKPDKRDFGVLLKREKYYLVENVYEKRLI